MRDVTVPSKNSHRLESVALPGPVPGSTQMLNFHHYGTPGAGPKAYLQAALHADETPGLLVLYKLLQKLDKADARGEIEGSIIVAPFANPVGLNQFSFGAQQGRFYAENGKNFNRDYPDIAEAVADRVADKLGGDRLENTHTIRAACIAIMAQMKPQSIVDVLKHALFSRAVDADFVFDLHCDNEAVLYFFVLPELWSQAEDLAAYLGCRSVLLAAPSPANPFDEANGALWQRLADRFPNAPIDNACMATTVELRGQTDVDENIAERDAQGIYAYLQARGVLAGTPPPVPALQCEPTPFDGVGQVFAPQAGVVSFCCSPGDQVEKGDCVATLFALDKDQLPTPLLAPVAGVLYSRRIGRYTLPGMEVCAIAGAHTLAENSGKDLLSD